MLGVDAGPEGVLGHKVAGLVMKRLINTDMTVNGERLGELVWRTLRNEAAAAVQTIQGCYTLAALLGDNQPQSLREQVAKALSALPLQSPDAIADNGKPLPGAVLAKAVAAIRPVCTCKPQCPGGGIHDLMPHFWCRRERRRLTVRCRKASKAGRNRNETWQHHVFAMRNEKAKRCFTIFYFPYWALVDHSRGHMRG